MSMNPHTYCGPVLIIKTEGPGEEAVRSLITDEMSDRISIAGFEECSARACCIVPNQETPEGYSFRSTESHCFEPLDGIGAVLWFQENFAEEIRLFSTHFEVEVKFGAFVYWG